MMASPGSVSRWIAALKGGDIAAAEPLWRRYCRQMVALARKMLRLARRRAADEEDVVQNAFNSFFKALRHGRFPDLDDRHGLERLLVVITTNKALKQLKHERRQKRGGEATMADTAIVNPGHADDGARLLDIIDAEPPPDLAAQIADELQRLLSLLGDDSLRKVAQLKLEGYGNGEIAEELACSLRTVARKLDAIRVLWNSHGHS